MSGQSPQRASTETIKFDTPFRAMFLHIARDPKGNIVSIALSHKGKDTNAQVSKLIEAIDHALGQLVGRDT